LSTLTVCALLVAWLLRWPWWITVLCAAAALFSREQNVVVVGLVLALAIRLRHRQLIAGLLTSLLLWSAWLCVLRILYGEWSLLPAGGNLGPPLAGVRYRWTHLTAGSRGFAAFHVVC